MPLTDKPSTDGRYITHIEAARIVGVSRNTLYEMQKRCPDFPKPYGIERGFMTPRYLRDDIEAWVSRPRDTQSNSAI